MKVAIIRLAASLLALNGPAIAAAVHIVQEAPVAVTTVAPGVTLVDFGRVAFGNLRLIPPAEATNTLTLHFGEAFADGRVNRQPPGSVRYATIKFALNGATSLVAAPPPDARNTRPPAAVLTPAVWGVVLPFRWVEIEGWPCALRADHLRRQSAFASTWDDQAASFRSSDALLDRIWELCRYSIKATTFAGVYVDGDRERIAYEGDAYLNQLSHYATDYAAQYLLEGLFANDAGAEALALITAPTERSWRHMVESGTTITWEAWDQKYKPNQDWNHAWGAAPANLLPRYVLGAKPIQPGWRRAAIQPHPGPLAFAEGRVPTPRGPILVGWNNNGNFRLSLTLPREMTARVQLPAAAGSTGVFSGGQLVEATRSGNWWLLENDVGGISVIEVR